MSRHLLPPAVAGIAAAALLAGCASTDARRDIGEAESAVLERTGHAPRWAESWAEPADWNPAAADQPLSADRAVAIALRQNPMLRESVTAIAAARASLAQAQTPPNPVVTFVYGAPTDGGPGSMITASVMMQLNWLLRRPHDVAEAEAALRAASLRATDAALALVADVRVAHARLVASEETAAAAVEASDALREALALAEERQAAGVATSTDARMAREAALVADRERGLAEAERERAQLELLALLAMSEAPTGWRTDGSWPPLDRHGDEDARAADAPSRRLDVAAKAADAIAADARLRRAGLGALPELDLGAMYERSMEGDETLGPSLSASLPIFDNGSAASAGATAELEMARLALAQAVHTARTEARTAAITWTTSERAWREGSLARAEIAERERDAQRDALRTGVTDRLTERSATAMAAERRMAAIRDRLAATEAAIQFERSVGGRPTQPSTMTGQDPAAPTPPSAHGELASAGGQP